MKLGLITPTLNLVVLAAAATAALGSVGCSFTNPLAAPPSQGSEADGGTSTNPNAGPPHALASITIGESHLSGVNTFTPEIAASFVPDASQVSSCTTTIAGCTIAAPAICDGTTGPLCQTGQACTLDSSCKPICQDTCTVQCPVGQVCYFPSPSTQACQPIQSFDAGDLILTGSGIASSVTLVPPSYALTTTSLTNPLVWGNTINVTSSGSAGAGFQAFQETVKATTLLQTSPSISKLTSQQIYSTSGLQIGWTPGSDSVQVSITGPKGTAQCSATDSAGNFTVPYQVVTAIAGAGNPSVSLSVARQHTEVKTDAKTQGTLSGETVQSVGYVSLSTVSIETATIEGCPTGEAACNGECVNVTSSSINCGACGISCGEGFCNNGVCSTTVTSCTSPLTLCSGTCVNLESSTTNCGDCGEVCPSGDQCVEGECTSATTCPTSYTMCSDGCQYLPTSSTDCGECGNSCDGGTCTSGVCSTNSTECSSCQVSAESGTCSSAYTTLTSDTNYSNFMSCMDDCATGETSCQATCEEDYPTTTSEAETLQSCICESACSSSCSTNTYCTTSL